LQERSRFHEILTRRALKKSEKQGLFRFTFRSNGFTPSDPKTACYSNVLFTLSVKMASREA
jgi:hypothetical protein